MLNIPGHVEAICAYIHATSKTMAGVEVFPAALLAKDKWQDVVLFLQELPIPERRKKELVVQWTQYVGAALTSDMVDEVLGPMGRRI